MVELKRHHLLLLGQSLDLLARGHFLAIGLGDEVDQRQLGGYHKDVERHGEQRATEKSKRPGLMKKYQAESPESAATMTPWRRPKTKPQMITAGKKVRKGNPAGRTGSNHA